MKKTPVRNIHAMYSILEYILLLTNKIFVNERNIANYLGEKILLKETKEMGSDPWLYALLMFLNVKNSSYDYRVIPAKIVLILMVTDCIP